MEIREMEVRRGWELWENQGKIIEDLIGLISEWKVSLFDLISDRFGI